MLQPMSRALEQLDDPVFLGVVVRSVIWSGVVFALLFVASSWGLAHLVGWVAPGGGWRWLTNLAAGLTGAVLAGLAAAWLFLPAALVIATLYIERIAAAVDRRWYPGLPAPLGAPLSVQAWDGLALGLQVLTLNVVAFGLALLLPGIGWALGWLVTGWAIGRGLFVAVAMRRMSREAALGAYASQRGAVLVQGLLLALASFVPGVNLLVPVLGVAAMVHVLHAVPGRGRAQPFSGRG